MTSKFGGALSKLRQVEPQKTEEPKTGIPENLNEDKDTGREKYSTYIDGELITRLKLYAVRHKLKHREVVEAAIQNYLDVKEHRNPSNRDD